MVAGNSLELAMTRFATRYATEATKRYRWRSNVIKWHVGSRAEDHLALATSGICERARA